MARWEKAPATSVNSKPARRTAQERRTRLATRGGAFAAVPTPPATPPVSPAPNPSPSAGEPETMEVDVAAGAASAPEPANGETPGTEAIPAPDNQVHPPAPPPRLTHEEAEVFFARVRVLIRSPGVAAAERALRELRRYGGRAPVRTLRLLESEARRLKRTVLADGIQQLFSGPV